MRATSWVVLGALLAATSAARAGEGKQAKDAAPDVPGLTEESRLEKTVAPEGAPVSTESGLVSFKVDGDHSVFDELRVGGLIRAGVLAQRRPSPHEDEVAVVAPTRSQISLDAIFHQDFTLRGALAWDGMIGATHYERPRNGKDMRLVVEEAAFEARSIADSPLWIRVGRQPIARGTGMLLGEDTEVWRKVHDAVLAAWETPSTVVHVYWERLARRGLPGIDSGAFTGRIDSGGVYVTKRFVDELGVDGYAIHLRDRSPHDPGEDRTTLGARAFGRVFDLVEYSFEGAYQQGAKASAESAEERIAAYAAEGEVSFDMRRLPLAPRLTLHGAIASGDKDPEDKRATTFDPMYEDGHGRFGYSDLFLLENIRAAGVRLAVRPTDSLLIEASFHDLWVDEPADANAPRFLAGEGRATSSRELGRDLSLRARWDPRVDFAVEAGGAVFLPGGYARAKLGGASALGRAYVLVEFRF